MDGGGFLHAQARQQVLVYMNFQFYGGAALLSFSAVSHSRHR